MSLYAEAFLLGSGKGALGPNAVERLFKAIDLDPDSRELVRLLLAELIKANAVKANLDKLKDLAARHPDSLSLANTVSDVLQAEGRPADALKAISDAIAVYKSADGAERVERDVLAMAASKLALLNAINGNFDEADDAVQWALEQPELEESPQALQAAMAVYSSALKDAKDSFFSIPWLFPSAKDGYSKKLDASSSSFVAAAAKAGRIDPGLYQTAFGILSSRGRSADVKEILLSNLLSNPADAESAIALAKLYAASGDGANACRAWKKVFSMGVKPSPQQYLSYGMAARQAGSLPEAANAFEWCLIVDPDNELAALELGWTYFEMRQIRKCLVKIEKLKPSVDSLYLKALCLQEFKRHAEALDAILKSEELAGEAGKSKFDERSYRFVSASFAEKARRPDVVERKMLPLIERNPNDAEALNFLGYTLAEIGVKLDDAERYIRRAVEIEPDSQPILDSMAWVLYRKGDFKGALPWIEKSLKAAGGAPDAVIIDHAGDIYAALGDKEAALKLWRQALETYSDETNPDAIAAKIAAASGSSKAAPARN